MELFYFWFWYKILKFGNNLLFFKGSSQLEANDPEFIRWMTAWLPAFATILAGIFVYFGEAKDYSPKNNGIKDGKFSIVEDFVE